MADGQGMDKVELKKQLMVVKKQEMRCAVGLGKDGAAVILLDKNKPATALEKDLEKDNPGIKNTRRGVAFVDHDADPRVLVLRLNKAASGLGRKLVKVVKVGGFGGVIMRYDDGTPEERPADEPDEAEPAAQAAAAPAAAAAPDAKSPAPPDAPAAPDMGSLTADLTALVKRMIQLIAADPTRQESLQPLAVTAQTAVKGGDPAAAKAAVGALHKAIEIIEKAAASPGAANGQADAATLAKARVAWLATRQRVDADLNKLLDAIRTTYKEHEGLADIEKTMQKHLDSVLDALDDSLAHKLDELSKVTAAERPKAVAEAQQILARYQQHLATDKVIGQLDDNPFVPIAVQKTVTAALAALQRNVR